MRRKRNPVRKEEICRFKEWERVKRAEKEGGKEIQLE
jgi:hypothetical protein